MTYVFIQKSELYFNFSKINPHYKSTLAETFPISNDERMKIGRFCTLQRC